MDMWTLCVRGEWRRWRWERRKGFTEMLLRSAKALASVAANVASSSPTAQRRDGDDAG